MLPCTMHSCIQCAPTFCVHYTRDCVIFIPMYNVHPYFSLKNLGKKVHIIHGKIRYLFFYPHLKTFFFFTFILTKRSSRERGREREKRHVREKHQLVASCMHPNHVDRGWNHKLGMCPDRESNPQPFGYGMMLQPTEPRQPGAPGFLRIMSAQRNLQL